MKRMLIVAGIAMAVMAAVLVAAYFLLEDPEETNPDFTNPPDVTTPVEEVCSCEICEECDGCALANIKCECSLCPGICFCDMPLDFIVTVESEWKTSESGGVLTSARGEAPNAVMQVFKMTIPEVLQIFEAKKVKGYSKAKNIKDFEDMTFDDFLKEVGKSRDEFAEDIVESGMMTGSEVVSTDKVEVGSFDAVRTQVEFSHEVENNDGEKETQEGVNIVYVLFDESSIYLLVYNGENKSDYIDEFEKTVKSFRINKDIV